MTNASIHVRLFERVIDLIYGEYDPTNITTEEQEQYTEEFIERMMRWKKDDAYRKIIGPLQPAYIFSRMAKVPVDVVEKIAEELDIALPEEVDISEFSIGDIPEDEADQLIEDGEEPLLEALTRPGNKKKTAPFEFVDLTANPEKTTQSSSNAMGAINYLEGIIERIKAGKVFSMTVIALLTDGNASLWIPGAVSEDEDVSSLYDPIIEVLKSCGPMTNYN